MSADPPEHDLLVLAGGGGSRLGGVDKASLQVAGRRLLERVLEAGATSRRTVVVGAVRVPAGVMRTLEDPPGGGPVAGIAAGLAALTHDAPAPWTVVIAVDQPEAAMAVDELLTGAGRAGAEVDLLCPHDETGHPQWLLAAYRTSALRAALEPLGSGHGTSVRRLVAGLRAVEVRSAHVGDIDTWTDHRAWEQRLSPPGGDGV